MPKLPDPRLLSPDLSSVRKASAAINKGLPTGKAGDGRSPAGNRPSVGKARTASRTVHARVASEHQEQAAVVKWAALMTRQWPELRLLFAVPNAAKRSPRLGAWMKAEGMQAGVPDLWLPVARGSWHGMAIEMKRAKGGSLPPAQQWWHTALREQNYRVHICRGAAEAIIELRDYLGSTTSGT